MTTATTPLIDTDDTTRGAPAERQGSTIFGVEAWQVVAGWSVVVMVGYMTFLIPFRHVVYPVFMLTTAVLLAIGIMKQRPDRPFAFWVFFSGTIAACSGDFVYYVFYGRLVGLPAPYPSVADVFYLLSYPLFALGLVLVARRRSGKGDFGGWIDTAIVSTAMGLLVFIYFVDPHLSGPGAGMPGRLVVIASPIMDVLILGVLARLVMSSGARTFAYRALACGFAVFLVSDLIYGGLAASGTYVAGVLDLGWMAARVLIAIAVLHPSVRDLAVVGSNPPPRILSLRRIIALGLLSLVGPVAFLQLSHERAHGPVAVVVAAGAAVLFVLVLARMGGLVRSLRASMEQLETEHVARRVLARRTLWTSERERNRLASDLHDGPVQQLTALSYRLEALRANVASDGRPDPGFNVVQQQLAAEVAALRKLMTALRPGALLERGLEAPITDHVAKTLSGSGIVSRISVDLPSRPDEEIETIVYRVVQDAIANAVRSAGAKTLEVSLSHNYDLLHLRVSDDGGGSEPDMSDLRLLSMKERIEMTGGTFSVSSTRGAGTIVEALVPMRGTP